MAAPYQAVGVGGPWMGMADYSRNIGQMERQDREHELAMRELEYLAGRQALGLDIGRTGGVGAGGANQFLQQWQEYLGQSAGVYNQALESYGQGFEYLQTAQGAAQQLGGLAGRVEEEYAGYREEFAPLQAEFTAAAGEELGFRGRMRGQLEALATPDYEGAAGRAIAGVAQQAGIQRQAEARRMQALGIDPTTQRGMAAGRGMAGQEALGRAMAGTQARMGEQQRVAGVTQAGLSLIDPSRTAGTALGIRTGANQLLGLAGELMGGAARTQAGIAQTAGGLAGGIAGVGRGLAQDIAGQYGDIAGLQMGLQYQQPGGVGGTALQSRGYQSPRYSAPATTGAVGAGYQQPAPLNQLPYATNQQPRTGSAPVYNYMNMPVQGGYMMG